MGEAAGGSARRTLIWGALVVALVAVVGAALLERLRLHKAPPFLGAVPQFSLLDAEGRPFTLRDLAGRPWVADFVFTRCTASCPLMTERMARLDRELGASSSVGLLSVSVDPVHDRPEVLARYARSAGASRRWRFLTGEPEPVYRLVREGFKLGVDPLPQAAAPGVAPEPITHSTRFVLIDGRARIRGYYDAFDRDAIAQLKRDLQALEEGG